MKDKIPPKQHEKTKKGDNSTYQYFWSKTNEELEKEFKTDLNNGLTAEEAQNRLKNYGTNELVQKKRSNWVLFFKQFNNSIIYILTATAIITFVLNHYPDSIVISAVIIANAFIGFFQEISADNALDKIKDLLVLKSYVVRKGRRTLLAAKKIVPGDLVSLEAGDSVPADLRLITADNLKIQEAVLTGETEPLVKSETALEKIEVPLAERTNMAFASTAVTSGSGFGIAVATGMNTQIGQIQQDVLSVKSRPTPLMKNLGRLGIALSLSIVFLAGILFLIGFYLEVYSLPVLLISIITLIVGSMPEGMPASVSVVLAMGTRKLTQKNAIVKTLPAVETLGAVDIVNTDKTGTLTKNEMAVTDVVTSDDEYEISGVGYDTPGGISNQQKKVNSWENISSLKWLVEIAGQTSDASFHKENGNWVLTGEPTDGALTGLYHKLAGKEPGPTEVDSLPFDSAFRYSARLVLQNGKKLLLVKGAPQTLLSLMEEKGGRPDKNFWNSKIKKLTKQGKRVVALGYQKVSAGTAQINPQEIGYNFNFIGLVGIIDPPRSEVKDAIKQLRYAGIKVKMITGDDPDTALAIAEKLEMGGNLNAITGPELEKMSEKELAERIDRYAVFARTTPSDKLRIVRAQQKKGHVVSMTGDGVNDASALKQADIGVAMGIKGTDVAKGAADMVLADDNFTTILSAVKEGRHVFDNIQKTIRFLLPTSFAEGLIVVFSILLNQEMPLYPTQLLWINMVSALTIQFAFIFEPVEAGIMARGPRNIKRGILTKADVFEIAYVSVLISSLGMLAYELVTRQGVSPVLGSTMTLNIIIFGKVFYLFNIRNNHPVFSRYFFKNRMAFYIIALLLILQVGIIYLPSMQKIFHTGTIGFVYGWFLPAGVGLIVLVVTELIKFLKSRLYNTLLKRKKL
ncbi:HAD-IC family P-type ATPase [Liquorilactobacillus oeni]|uniref:Cation transport ATPase n=1 Tax=Liquorilactobacillus oeni DSM 19972 TaxID=1423777 RepID=A0A0R1MCG4_9LACO|nr:HAD-IC family P-type ATPase [Liquorilactobacillus oeni]KRL05702.1 cation transport ATPase [Liquorilactobacillus oeni DSM 19972]